MIKTNLLFKKFFKLLNEQEPAVPVADPIDFPTNVNSTAQTPDQPQVDEPLPAKEMDKNTKYVIKILTNAFIFNPKNFDPQKQKYIYNKIDEIKGKVNKPVASIVEEIKKIIALDNSLRIESKTLKILNSYMVLMEQSKDATEPSSNNKAKNLSGAESLDDSENELNLAEIFPLYKKLILKALKHTPTEQELMIILPLVNEFADVDPQKILEQIENMLLQSEQQKEEELKKILSKV
jgi:hypothetical protein